MSNPSVVIQNLGLNFGPVSVLKDLNLEIAEGEFLVLLGSSGCGKSTLLNCIAGLLESSAGRIFIKGRNVTWEEPSKRGIGMVFQSYALYPQMTVRGNLSFGLRNAGVPKIEIEKRVEHASKVLQIGPLLERKPAALSGGQRQRVAIGRALVRDVDVFLFDEPLSNLDAKLRADLRVEIKRLHQNLKNTMIYVTHDQVEAMTLADRIAIMKDGLIQQLADPHTIYNKPVNRYVAGFIGSPSMNMFDGTVQDRRFQGNGISVPLDAYEFTRPTYRGNAWLGIRPEHVVICDQRGQLPVEAEITVELYEPMGSDTLVYTQLAGTNFRFRVDGQRQVRVGEKLLIGFDPARTSLFDGQDEHRI